MRLRVLSGKVPVSVVNQIQDFEAKRLQEKNMVVSDVRFQSRASRANLCSENVLDKFYITTAIDYPNGRPHIGHAYEKIVTDCYARWYRFLGRPTHFLTGTDENGQKLVGAAEKAGLDTKIFVDQNVALFHDLCSRIRLSHDDFIRTTEERHKKVCEELWQLLDKAGDIYFGRYSGSYCLLCENFYTPSQAPEGICPHHDRKLEDKEEEGYFFKMGRYGDWIVRHIEEHPDFITPSKARKELLGRLRKDGVRDVAFSRPGQGWGIPVPGDGRFVMYTWADALVNYYSAVVGSERWPADVHVIGKDIVWFHCVIWPCMLKACNLDLPKQVYVHGMVLAEGGKKMSKSLGNVIDPFEMLEKYPLDTFRYYLLRHLPAKEDGVFSENELIEKHNNELGNDYGNLITRVLKLSLKNLEPRVTGEGVERDISFEKTFGRMRELMDRRDHNLALGALWQGVNELNGFINEREPWKYKGDPEKLRAIIYNCCFGIHSLALMLSPFLPATGVKTLEWLGVSPSPFADLRFGEVVYDLSMPEILFQKMDKSG